MSTLRADLVIADLRRAHDREKSDMAANALLNEVFAGYPAERLLPLLGDQNPHVVVSTAWILSELGDRAAPYIGAIDQLLVHPQREVRYWAIQAVLAAASQTDGSTIAKAISLIMDPERAVRIQAVQLLAHASDEQLSGAVPYLDSRHLHALLKWLLDDDNDQEYSNQILARLDAGDEVTRRFAAAAAVRVGRVNPLPLEKAAASADDIVSFIAQLTQKIGAIRASGLPSLLELPPAG